ncbi:hypothetical protein ABIC65_001039 [Sphingomonas trueperi]|uniref:hypothetical protein n=1 Tax=Sphingomonas trueperi TaxID=53317 RepID=UPI0033928E7A
MAEVTQADRDAAARRMPLNTIAEFERVAEVKRGEQDNDPLVQEFARHRTEAVKPLVEALENVVAPLALLQREAEARGNRLSGVAYSIANDLGFVQKIARDALEAFRSELS